MHFPKRSFFLIAAILLIAASVSFSQTEPRPAPEPSYELMLQVVIGSNTGEKAELPQTLAALTRHLRDDFGFTNYRVANTFVGRLANSGNIEYKSVSDVFGRESQGDAPTFLAWSLGGFRTFADTGGRNAFSAQAFRFGARVPVRVQSRDEAGRTASAISYEPIGLTVNRLGLVERTPTLIGTLSLPKAEGTMFLIATVRPAESAGAR
jgi:hypothetical protein